MLNRFNISWLHVQYRNREYLLILVEIGENQTKKLFIFLTIGLLLLL